MTVRNTRTVATVVALLTATAFMAAACQPASAPWTSDVPSGHLDAVTLDSTGTRLSVRGWAGDRNTTSPIAVVVFVDGRLQPGTHGADRPRPDVAAQTGRGARSGFDVTITVTERTRADVCVSALNVGPGDHALLGCVRNVTPRSAPASKPTPTTTPPSLAMSYPSGKFAPDAGSTVSPKVLNATGPVRFTVTSGELPVGVSFDSDTGVFTGLATWPTGIVTVSNGSAHSCGVDTRGAAWCWGSNRSGQLGDGNNNDSNVPVSVSGLGSRVNTVAAGGGSQLCGCLGCREMLGK